MTDFEFRRAVLEDLPEIASVYNRIIEERGFTAHLDAVKMQEMEKWFDMVNTEPYGIYTVLAGGTIAGYFYFSPWRSGRRALDQVAEVSYYLDKDYRGRGLGKAMIDEMISIASAKQFQHLLAIMLDSNVHSRKLLETAGFTHAGTLDSIAVVDGRRCGQVLMQKTL